MKAAIESLSAFLARAYDLSPQNVEALSWGLVAREAGDPWQDDTEHLAVLVEALGMLMFYSKDMATVGAADRLDWLLDRIGARIASPFCLVGKLMGLRRADLAALLGVSPWRAGRLCAHDWLYREPGVEQDRLLAALGVALVAFLTPVDAQRRAA